MRSASLLGALIFTATAFVQSPVWAQALTPHQQLARDIHKELVEIKADVRVLSPAPRKGNLVARLRGTGARKPILLLAHLDVVAASASDWSAEPFKLLETRFI